MLPAPRLRTPDQLLQQAQAEEAYERRGKLKVFLGYASGVGKSFRMLDEGRRRRERGEDVIVGATQLKTSPEVESLLGSLEVVPLKSVDDTMVMDLPEILKRHPSVCLVDGLAYDNPHGCTNPYRWQDVEELLEAGISVITSVNIQYIDELRERVERITGKKVTQTVPRQFLNSADEIAVVDAPSEKVIRASRNCATAGGRCCRPAIGDVSSAQWNHPDFRRSGEDTGVRNSARQRCRDD